MEHLLYLYLFGIIASIIGCSIFITIEIIKGRKFMFSSKQVWYGILFYTILSWVGFMVYCWCLYLVFFKRVY